MLTRSLLSKRMDMRVEEVFIIHRYMYAPNQLLLSPVPNRADDKKNDFTVWKQDVVALADPGNMEVLGYIHTHRPFSDNEYPTQRDYDGLPDNYIGAVYMHGGGYVYWYTNHQIINSTPVDGVDA